jgi:hypothetical protein
MQLICKYMYVGGGDLIGASLYSKPANISDFEDILKLLTVMFLNQRHSLYIHTLLSS